jgi:hypothetical protein
MVKLSRYIEHRLMMRANVTADGASTIDSGQAGAARIATPLLNFRQHH